MTSIKESNHLELLLLQTWWKRLGNLVSLGLIGDLEGVEVLNREKSDIGEGKGRK